MNRADAPALSFKVLTLNTHKGFTSFNRRFVLHELREAVRATGADVVFLQEVLGSHKHHSRRQQNWPPTPQYEFLADTMWKEFAYGRNAVYPQGDHGNAILSKFPILRYENRDVSVGRREPRGLLHCVLKAPGPDIELHAICVHFAVFESHRRRQLRMLCRFIRDEIPADAPLVVAGDFNDWRVLANHTLERGAGLKEAFVEQHGRSARTFHARWPVLRLDRIYYRNVRIVKPAVHSVQPWSHLSDHAPLSAEVVVA
ncbi:MAG TPA: endonuclease/exonuclease/phosphatase family protein [Candidatus Binatia bacterium]|nr:endonuclease/exonuclease/phosphatase family protein [Candidatus Binatia bacterium]